MLTVKSILGVFALDLVHLEQDNCMNKMWILRRGSTMQILHFAKSMNDVSSVSVPMIVDAKNSFYSNTYPIHKDLH